MRKYWGDECVREIGSACECMCACVWEQESVIECSCSSKCSCACVCKLVREGECVYECAR